MIFSAFCLPVMGGENISSNRFWEIVCGWGEEIVLLKWKLDLCIPKKFILFSSALVLEILTVYLLSVCDSVFFFGFFAEFHLEVSSIGKILLIVYVSLDYKIRNFQEFFITWNNAVTDIRNNNRTIKSRIINYIGKLIIFKLL